MKKINIIWLFALIALAFSSCHKDINEFIPDKEGQNFKSSLFGSVVDEAGQPVENAIIRYGANTKMTDKNGIYQFKNVDVNSKHNLITISKQGYFEGSRVFTTDRSTTITIRNILLEKSFDKSFESTTAASLKKGAVTLDFPADAIVMASNNSPYSGTVMVAMKYLDPNQSSIYTQMPGDLVGINAANQIAGMTTYGMVAVELQTPSGLKLQLAPGKTVKMSNKLSGDVLAKAPSTIPLWYYDENLGYWKEEGEAKLVNDTYVGEVAHFTYWNYDAQQPSIIMSGRVVDQNGDPIAGADVWIVAQGGNGGGHGLTNLDGTFSGQVTKDAILNIKVSLYINGCTLTEVYNGQAGPFSSDVTIPDIVSTLGNINNIHVTANVEDCNGDPVQNGYLKVSSGGNVISYLDVVNGVVNSTVVNCNTLTTVTFVPVDIDALIQGDPMTLSAATEIDLGTITACGNIADFLKVEVADLGLDTTLLSGVLFINGNSFTEINAGNGIDSSTQIDFHLYWQDNTPNIVKPGTYNVFPNETHLQLLITPVQYLYLTAASASAGTVTVTQGGSQPGDVITGTYEYIGTEAGTTITHQVSGSFRQTLQ